MAPAAVPWFLSRHIVPRQVSIGIIACFYNLRIRYVYSGPERVEVVTWCIFRCLALKGGVFDGINGHLMLLVLPDERLRSIIGVK